jgi:hypothetical protein
MIETKKANRTRCVIEDDLDFVLPPNGPALFVRYPRVVEIFIRGFLNRHHRDVSIETVQDLVMGGWVHLFSRPSHGRKRNMPSVHRGIDRVAMFAPDRIGGANSKRFFAYIKKILYNWYCTQCSSDAYDHVTISIALDGDEEGGIQESCLSEECMVMRREISIIQHIMLSEFLTYLQRIDGTIYKFVRIFYETGTYSEAASELGLDPGRATNRMRECVKAFHNK